MLMASIVIFTMKVDGYSVPCAVILKALCMYSCTYMRPN